MKKIIIKEDPDLYKYLYVVGDIHGDWLGLKDSLTGVKDSIVFICGDCGIGFKEPHESFYEFLEKHEIMILCIRGNHDRPEDFEEEKTFLEGRIKLLPGNSLVRVLGYNILCIGGATSIKKIPDETLWEGENVEKDEELLEINDKIDIIISHEAPMSFEPPAIRTKEISYDTWENILKNRKFLQRLKEYYNPKYYYYGHHHQNFSGTSGRTSYRGLGICDILEIPERENSVRGDDND